MNMAQCPINTGFSHNKVIYEAIRFWGFYCFWEKFGKNLGTFWGTCIQ